MSYASYPQNDLSVTNFTTYDTLSAGVATFGTVQANRIEAPLVVAGDTIQCDNLIASNEIQGRVVIATEEMITPSLFVSSDITVPAIIVLTMIEGPILKATTYVETPVLTSPNADIDFDGKIISNIADITGLTALTLDDLIANVSVSTPLITTTGANISLDSKTLTNVGGITGLTSLSLTTLTASGSVSTPSITTAGTDITFNNKNITNVGNLAGTLTTAAQPNVTSLGTLTGLTISGTLTQTGTRVSVNNVIGAGKSNVYNYTMAIQTTNAVATNMTLPSGSELTITANTSWDVMIRIVARKSAGTGTQTYFWDGGVECNASATATQRQTGNMIIVAGIDAATFAVSVVSSTTLRIAVTGIAATTINWTASVTVTESKD